MDGVVSWINDNGPSMLVVDDPESQIDRSVPYQTQHLQEIVTKAFAYRKIAAENGWTFLERRRSSEKLKNVERKSSPIIDCLRSLNIEV